MGFFDRIDLARGKGLTLGTLAEMVAGVHPKRVLVTEPGGPTLTASEAAELVDLWAGGVAARGGDRVPSGIVGSGECFPQRGDSGDEQGGDPK